MINLLIRPELFWDMNLDDLDEEKHKKQIIQQVLMLGTLDEFSVILNYYGAEVIKEVIQEAGYLDPKTLEFVVSYFGLKKSKIRCYTKKQLNQPRWN